MIVLKSGHVSQPKSIGAMLRQRWEDIRDSIAVEIARRDAMGIPLDELKPVPPYSGNADLDGVMVRLRTLQQDEVAHAEISAREAIDLDDDTADGKRKADAASREAMRAFVTLAVVEVSGLADEDGIPVVIHPKADADGIAMLEDNRLLEPLYKAAMAYQLLSASEKKAFGSSAPSTSPTSIAGGAPNT